MKKGFTLIELLAVIFILGIVLAIAIPGVQQSVSGSKSSLYKTAVSEIIKGAKSYALDHASDISGLAATGTGYITIGTLISSNELPSKISNPVTGNNFDNSSVVRITTDNNGEYDFEFLVNGVPSGDGTPPVITLLGASSVNISQGSSYIDAGATALDNLDGNITSRINSTGTVSTGTPGTYTITYNVSDTAGNPAILVTRTVIVVANNTNIPVITMNGSNPVTVNLNASYTDAGATATDNVDGNITALIKVTSNLNVSLVGSYKITYTVSDKAGNTVTSVRTVNVTDGQSPVIAFSPNGNTSYKQSDSTTVTVTDNGSLNSGSLKYQWATSSTAPTEASFSTSFSNFSKITTPAGISGSYYLWILAKDTGGNTTIAGSNAFYIDNTPPVIAMSGSTPVSIRAGSSYSDAGATATDTVDGNLTSKLTITSNINLYSTGGYNVTYSVSDKAGNTSTSVVRTVNVILNTVEYLVVGGGGGGGMDMAGGGGGGGFLAGTAYSVNNGSSYAITVGSGGAGAPAAGTNGQNTGHPYWIEAKNGNNSSIVLDTTWGSSSAMAGKSCYSLMLDGVSSDGVYWIDPDGVGANTPFQVYCDMHYDGGGWAMLMKATAGATFSYNATYWTTANTLNPADLTLNNADAKYRSYNEMVVTDFMARWPDVNSGNYRWVENGVNSPAITPLSLFSTANNKSAGAAKNNDNWNAKIISSQAGNSFYGFNFTANASDLVRWGFGWNNEADWLSNDVSGGIGMSRVSYSAGDYIYGSQDNTGINRSARIEMYGRNSNDTADTLTAIVALGGGAGGSSYFDYSPGSQGARGASGGGTSGYSNGGSRAGGASLSGQGNAGGTGNTQYYSGGGGGAGGPGASATAQANGGIGKYSNILGTGYYFGGGGGGAAYSLSTGGNGGLGGGGGGAVGATVGGAGINNGSPGGGGSPNAQTNTPGGNAGTNTGGGGGGGSHYNANNKGGDGGSGIVIIRYLGSQAATGGTITSWNGYTIHTFYTSGTFAAW